MDKKTFDERIDWVEQNLDALEVLAVGQDWKERPMYLKAVMAVRKAQAGKASGHLVGFDAICSGMQIMSAMAGCVAGATATGLVDPTVRADAYTDCSHLMTKRLGFTAEDQRLKLKDAVMHTLYGSKKTPQVVFGEETPELQAFYEAMYELCPGAVEMLNDLLDSWQPYALEHSWPLPDGFKAIVKVMQTVDDCRIEVDELNHATFTYQYAINQGEKSDVKNAANVVHSIDAYVLRSLIRRCNYDHERTAEVYNCIIDELTERLMGASSQIHTNATPETDYYVERYESTGIADVVILPYLDRECIRALSTDHLTAIQRILHSMLEHKPFEIVTVHDDFKCHPNYMNHLRAHYRDILAELAEGNLMADVLGNIHGMKGTFTKKTQDLGDKIRLSNYALS